MENGKKLIELVQNELKKAIVGKKEVIELLMIALFSSGHVILEGVPGVAKTTIAKNFARVVGLSFSRIQLTPDLLPADIVGIVYYDQKSGEWITKKGPIFANIVLADEINRAQPKTQSALLEAMQEQQVTIENVTYKLPKPFMVIATMNPIEQMGVYPLPEAQLDRFLMKIEVGFPSKDEEIRLLKRKSYGEFYQVSSVVSREELLDIMDRVKEVQVSDEIIEYIYSILIATRTDKRVLLGASPRAGEHLLFASKAKAFIEGRDYVIPDDIKNIAIPVLAHRLILKAEYEFEGITTRDIIREILEKTAIPV